MKFEASEKLDRFRLLASPKPVAGAATINQDASLSVAELTPGKKLSYPLGDDRHAWLQVIRGEVVVNGKTLVAGDAVAADKEHNWRLRPRGQRIARCFCSTSPKTQGEQIFQSFFKGLRFRSVAMLRGG